MLTGDKLETAINIGKTCGLITNNFKVFTCNESKIDACLALLATIAIKARKHKNSALVIEGHSLEIILYDPSDNEKVVKYDLARIHTLLSLMCRF